MLKVLLLVVLHITLLHKNGVAQTTTEGVFHDEYDYISTTTTEDGVNVTISSETSDDIDNVDNEIKSNDLKNAYVSTTRHSFPSSTSTDEFSTISTTVGNVCAAPNLRYSNLRVFWEFETESCGEIAYVQFACNKLYNNQEDIKKFEFNVTNFWDINKPNEDLPTGIRYNCDVYATDEYNVRVSESTSIIIPPGSLEIRVTVNPTNISWTAPFENQTLTYNVTLEPFSTNRNVPPGCEESNENRDTFSYITPDTFYTFNESSIDYVASISTKFWNTIIENEETAFINATAAPSEPRNVSVREYFDENNEKQYELRWETPCQSNDEIKLYQLLITDSDETTIENKTVENDKNNAVNLTKLAPNANYSLQLFALGAAGEGGKSAIYQFYTTEITPSPTISITDTGSTYFTIEWSINESLIPYNYSVEIKNLGANYSRNSHCPEYPDPELYYTNKTSYNFTNARPFYNYNVTVTVAPDKISKKEEFVIITTTSSEPDVVTNLTFRVNNETLQGELQWKLPCDVNGLISNFEIIMSEKYTEDELETSETFIIPKTDFSRTWNLKPSHIYNIYIAITLEDGLQGDNATVLNYKTESGLPGLPVLSVSNVTNTSFQINWSRPEEKTGPIEYYELLLVPRPNYAIPPDCPIRNESLFLVFNKTSSIYANYSAPPDHAYAVSLRANTTKGFGNYSIITFVTDIGEPEKVRHVNTDISNDVSSASNVPNVLFSFDAPCNSFGTIMVYTLKYVGYRYPYENVTGTYQIPPRGSKITFDLKPEFVYEYQIEAINNKFRSVYRNRFEAPAGAPKTNVNASISVGDVTTESARIVLKKEYFDFYNGDVKYVALLLSEIVLNNDTHKWNFEKWPDLEEGTQQLTNCFWNPFESSNETVFTIGKGSNCTSPCICKNSVLKDDTRYILTIQAFNSDYYGNIKSIAFITDKISHLAVILGVIFGILFFFILALAGFFVWKKKLYKKITYISPRKSSSKSIEFSSTAVPPKKFIQYFRNTENRPDVLKNQFAEITEKSKEVQAQKTCHFAGLLENKRKNRYSNISPYDDTRVKLLIDEDDEIGSDYINASYIKGYSGTPEYIATQGPLSTTCRDFWKMVIQENVSIIVMVAQFVENNKDKCYKYFPKNHENLIVSDDMEIRCSTELHFGTYLVRNLQIRKDCQQVAVTHMQFLEWPDFNVPTGTEHMLQFIYKMRERLKLESGLVIVHCSAGVGRTGTLIAADMLLQNADAGKQLDVFDTVMGLRQQRTCMVQTLEQYIYLHRLIADHIDRPLTPDLNETNDPVYENMDILKNNPDSPLKAKEQESKF
ncbi:unnamed protein product [Phyllotreta striolata]|uniref:protein-tyrosine-phosphatase n=1 Tax=Phyllotreta striolata TaxID=444603 RepID=A0A9N9XNC2_PHYSR|nr:unnamed protein product [Phyllotreta striolata]